MKRIALQAAIMALIAIRLPAQTSLEFFTNQANALLQPAFGFGVANIPVYSSTNPAIAYGASLHYLLQSAANAYDATTPATDSPSVFRPLFAWTSNTLFIVGYTNVTTDFYAQTGRGFKSLTDPTISSNDNVWGIPWVVGMKNNPPAFNEYCYSSAVTAERKVLFVRFGSITQPVTNRPPQYTNQFFMMAISNMFGVEAWNFSRSNFPDPVTIVASNEVTISITNNYNWGTNVAFSAATNWVMNSWPGWTGNSSDGSFLVPIFTNVISLPPGYFSESTAQFIPLTNDFASSNQFQLDDMQQTGWPVHNWVLNITNNLMYALIDNSSGQVLDFVNLGGFGSSLSITNLLVYQPGLGFGGPTNRYAWQIGNATDAPNSPMSFGLLYQITVGGEESTLFANSLNGAQPSVPGYIFGAPFNPSAEFVQNCTWQTGNPLVHYTVEDLTTPENEGFAFFSGSPSLDSEISDSNCTLGKINEDYNSRRVGNLSIGASTESFQLNFTGVNDLPYAIFASPDLLDWTRIGIASQLSAGIFQFNDPAATNYPARFYQVRLP